MRSIERKGITTKHLRLIARIWSAIIIVITVFIFLGYLENFLTTGQADPYSTGDYPPIENIPPIFNLISVLGLAIAWKWELIGGIISVLFQLILMPIYLIHWPLSENIRYLIASYGILFVALIPGILFVVCWYRSRKYN